MGQNASNQKHHLLNQYEKTNKSYAKEINRKNFLLRCKNLQLIPNFVKIGEKNLNFHKTDSKTKYTKILNIFYFQLLNICISDNFSKLKFLTNSLNKTKNNLDSNFNKNFLNNFYSEQNKKHEHFFNKIKNKHIKNINNLMIKQHSPEDKLKINNEWITNLTETNIPEHIKYILSLGSKFSTNEPIIPKKIENIITNIEAGIDELNTNDKELIRNKITNILTNNKNKLINSNKKIRHKINYFLKEAKSFLSKHKSLFVMRADKSNKTVIMKKDEYYKKMSDLLNDSNTYKKVAHDLTKQIQNKINGLINNMFRKKYIDKKTKNLLNCHNGQSPYIYGLPKLHKNNIPLRPIVSTVGSPTDKLSKFLSNILTNILGNTELHIKDSWDFHNFIKNKTIPKNYTLISFDVVSLYTNIPTELAVNVIKEKWNIIKNYTTIPENTFIEITKLCLNSTYFKFNNEFFSQIYGVAMGSPISATIANLVLEFLEIKVISSLDYKPYFFKRFVDDCILCIPKNKLQYTLNKFNSFHEKLKFTHENENNKSINFLDINITYDNEGNIETKWYTKPVWSGRYLNFNSYTPEKYKKSVVNTLTDRAVKLTHTKHRPTTLQKVRTVLQNNNYPKTFYEPIIKNRINKIYNTNEIKQNGPTNNKFISLPYIPEITNKIRKVLKPYNINVAEKSCNSTKHLFTSLKPEVPKTGQANLIYQIDCIDCPKTYIGQTKQYLKNRIQQHKYSIRNTQEQHTALSTHALDNLHNFNFNEVKILEFENNSKKRNIKEMIHIKKTKNAINYRTDTDNLSTVYYNLIK